MEPSSLQRVLVVNDVPMIRAAVEAHVRALGAAEVLSAGDGLEALEILAAESVQLVVSDLHMPSLDGFQLCRVMRSLPPLKEIPVVLLSATYREFVANRLAREVAADAFVHWPCTREELRRAIEEAASGKLAAGGDARILVVEDDEAMRDALVTVLRKARLDAMGVADGETAIDQGRAWTPDLVLCDYMMPKVDGKAVLAWYREHRSDTPVIIMTAYGSEQLAVELMKMGAFDYLTKPVELRSIVALCRSALERDGLRKVTHDFEDLLGELRRSERAWERTFESVDELILVVDEHSRVVLANPSMLSRLPAHLAQPRGLSAAEILYGEHGRTQDPLSAARALGRTCAEECKLPGLGDGFFRVSVTPYLGDLGQFEGATIVIRDVTAERSERQQILVNEKMATIRRLAAGIAHEINNPAGFVLLNLQHLGTLLDELRALVPSVPEGKRSPAVLVSEMRALVPESLVGIERIRDLTRQLRVLAPGATGARRLVDLNEVVRAATSTIRQDLFKRARVALALGQIPTCDADPGRLGEVVTHLLLNAADAIPEGSPDDNTIRITTTAPDGRVQLVVEDTGCGIPEDIVTRIFEPFFTTKAHEGHKGLGLALCFETIERHGGEIRVESAPGQGSRFIVLLPAAARPPEVHEEPPPVAAPRKLRVLLIDDEDAYRRSLKRVLREMEIEEAESGRAALERLQADGSWDAILCDVAMPGLSGLEVFGRVRSDFPGLVERFVFVTGGARTPEADAALSRSGRPVLEKPFGLQEIRDMIAALPTSGPIRRPPR
jgi:CheY-like chemotaxis protein/signal transduction histidine kinase